MEHVRRHSKIRLSENLIFLPLYPCFHSTASGTRSQTFQTTSWSKLRKRSTTINAQFNELNEKSSISFSFYTRCIESERAQSSTCWTVYPSWNQKRGWWITIKMYQSISKLKPEKGLVHHHNRPPHGCSGPTPCWTSTTCTRSWPPGKAFSSQILNLAAAQGNWTITWWEDTLWEAMMIV